MSKQCHIGQLMVPIYFQCPVEIVNSGVVNCSKRAWIVPIEEVSAFGFGDTTTSTFLVKADESFVEFVMPRNVWT